MMVAFDFLYQRIAPFKSLRGPLGSRNDDMRPSTTDLDMKMVSRVLLLKCGFKATKELIDFPAGIGCYYLSSEARREVLRRMPALQDIGLSMQHSTIGDWWIYEGQNAGR
jgi:hypothetical protein